MLRWLSEIHLVTIQSSSHVCSLLLLFPLPQSTLQSFRFNTSASVLWFQITLSSSGLCVFVRNVVILMMVERIHVQLVSSCLYWNMYLKSNVMLRTHFDFQVLSWNIHLKYEWTFNAGRGGKKPLMFSVYLCTFKWYYLCPRCVYFSLFKTLVVKVLCIKCHVKWSISWYACCGWR